MMKFLTWLLNLFKATPVVAKPMEPIKEEPVVPTPPTPSERLYTIAVSKLGQDASPRDFAPDEYGCVESFCEVYKLAFGTYPDGKTVMPLVSTIVLNKVFRANPDRFQPTLTPEKGVIILSVTGSGNGVIPNGHVGVLGENSVIITNIDNRVIMSNNSFTGKWDNKFTMKTWVDRYRTKGGMQVFLFKVI